MLTLLSAFNEPLGCVNNNPLLLQLVQFVLVAVCRLEGSRC